MLPYSASTQFIIHYIIVLWHYKILQFMTVTVHILVQHLIHSVIFYLMVQLQCIFSTYTTFTILQAFLRCKVTNFRFRSQQKEYCSQPKEHRNIITWVAIIPDCLLLLPHHRLPQSRTLPQVAIITRYLIPSMHTLLCSSVGYL